MVKKFFCTDIYLKTMSLYSKIIPTQKCKRSFKHIRMTYLHVYLFNNGLNFKVLFIQTYKIRYMNAKQCLSLFHTTCII